MNCSVPNNFMRILNRHVDCTPSILSKASVLSREEVEFSTDPEVIRIRGMVNSVLAENHMMKAFVRLKPQGEKILYGYMKPEHDIWALVGRFFAKRFPGTVIVLGNNLLSHVFLFDGNAVNHSKTRSLTMTLKDLKKLLGKTEAGNTEALWEAYYWSQYRPEAKNTRYFKQNVRAKYVKSAGITAETDSGGTRLEDFFAIV